MAYVFLLALLVAIGLPWVSASVLAALVVGGSIAMTAVTRRVGLGDSFVSGLVALLGGAIPFLAFVVVLSGGMFTTIARGVLLGVVLLGVFGLMREIRSSFSFETDVMVVLAAIVVLSLSSKMWYHMLPMLAGLVICIGARRFSRSEHTVRNRFLGVLSILSVAGGAWWSSIVTGASWAEGSVFRSSDQYFRASLGIGTTTFGVNENMGASGYPIRYHWLSEAFVTMMGRFVSISPIDAVVWLSPVIGTLGTVAVTYKLVHEIGGKKSEAFIGALIISTLSVLLYSQGINILKTTEMGQFWGTPLFLFGVLLFYKVLERRTVGMSLLLVVWFPLLVMTNSTLGLSFACGTGAVILVAVLRRTFNFWIAALLIGGLFIDLVVLQRSLLASTSLAAFAPHFQVNDPFAFSLAFGYKGNNGTEKALVGLALLVVLWFQGGAALWLRASGKSETARNTLALFTAAAAVPAFLISVLDGFEQYRFLNPILILGPISIALALPEIRQVLRLHPLVIFGLVVSAISLGLQANVLEKVFGSFQELHPRLRYAALLVSVPLLCFMLIKALGAWSRFGQYRHIRAVGVFGLFSLVVPVVAILKSSPGQYDYAHQLSAPSVANAGRIACLDFVRSSTTREDVIASYMWRFGDDPSTEKWFIVSAVSERRTYVDGPIYVENPQTDWIKLRQDITTRFVEAAPNYADRAVMHKAGVEYFIVDTRWTKRQTWEPYASRVFSNQDCIVLRLEKPSS